MKTVTIADLQRDVTHYLELAEGEDMVILNNGKPVGILRGIADDDDLFDYEFEQDPRFLERVKRTRAQFRAGGGIRLEDLRDELLNETDKVP
ncbi:MAG: type II toxin-antitoxin system Phd/YefM family antitoxin [Chloroflexaceae bacterium]|jgi:antitoxin (DNA-binding transcriptional repressor) of toxin-antitoxin stability system|nr:type II toxin-antitoxin system Phd/YefM family antitoxin [Chloroflexaceae bacterium]